MGGGNFFPFKSRRWQKKLRSPVLDEHQVHNEMKIHLSGNNISNLVSWVRICAIPWFVYFDSTGLKLKKSAVTWSLRLNFFTRWKWYHRCHCHSLYLSIFFYFTHKRIVRQTRRYAPTFLLFQLRFAIFFYISCSHFFQ